MSLQDPGQKNVLRILPKTPFDFSNLAPGTSQFFPLAQHIDVGQATQISLVARLHAADIGSGSVINANLLGIPSSPSVALVMYGDAWTLEDPGTELGVQGVGTPLATCAFTSQTSAPCAMIVSPTAPFGRLVLIGVMAVQALGSAVSLQAIVSLDLILKGDEERASPSRYNTYLGYC
jgi:hypothetical protein